MRRDLRDLHELGFAFKKHYNVHTILYKSVIGWINPSYIETYLSIQSESSSMVTIGISETVRYTKTKNGGKVVYLGGL